MDFITYDDIGLYVGHDDSFALNSSLGWVDILGRKDMLKVGALLPAHIMLLWLCSLCLHSYIAWRRAINIAHVAVAVDERER